MVPPKRILIIAGPNGAGKTLFATEFLPSEAECPNFINADHIAAGLKPFRPHLAAIRAGRLMLSMIHGYVSQGESFSFETTLSGRGYARLIPRWRERRYWIKLFYLRLLTPEMAIARVAQRTAEGGHDVPVSVIKRRFHSGWRNFEHIYRDLVDEWAVYDNSGVSPVLMAEGRRS